MNRTLSSIERAIVKTMLSTLKINESCFEHVAEILYPTGSTNGTPALLGQGEWVKISWIMADTWEKGSLNLPSEFLESDRLNALLSLHKSHGEYSYTCISLLPNNELQVKVLGLAHHINPVYGLGLSVISWVPERNLWLRAWKNRDEDEYTFQEYPNAVGLRKALQDAVSLAESIKPLGLVNMKKLLRDLALHFPAFTTQVRRAKRIDFAMDLIRECREGYTSAVRNIESARK